MKDRTGVGFSGTLTLTLILIGLMNLMQNNSILELEKKVEQLEMQVKILMEKART